MSERKDRRLSIGTLTHSHTQTVILHGIYIIHTDMHETLTHHTHHTPHSHTTHTHTHTHTPHSHTTHTHHSHHTHEAMEERGETESISGSLKYRKVELVLLQLSMATVTRNSGDDSTAESGSGLVTQVIPP